MASTTSISLDTGRGPTPIEVDAELTITIDPHDLGTHIAGMLSDEQAQVILGFYGEVFDAQLLHIGAESVFDGAADPNLRADVARVLRDLAAAIEKGE